MTLDLLVLGLAIALEPLPLSAHILVLSSERGTRKGAGFVLGWVLTLVGLVGVTLLLTGGKPLASGSAPSTASLVVKILLGAGLLAFAWRKRSRGSQPARPSRPPRWMAAVDRIGFAGAMVLGFLVQPWPLVAAGVASVTAADLSDPVAVATLVVFCVLASSTYLTMQAYATLAPDTSRARLDGLNGWLSAHQERVVVAVSVTVGLWLVATSTYRLLT